MIYHVILLIIISNDILLNPPIALTYHLVLDGSSFWYTKSHSYIVRNRFSFIAFLNYISLSFYYNFDIYLQTSYLLRFDLLQSDPIGNLNLLLKPYGCKLMTESSYNQSQPWSVICIITKNRLQFIQNLKALEWPYKW